MVVVAGEHFADNVACLTCAHVLVGAPIHLVFRDEDGDWQFLCGSGHGAADARLIGLGEAVAIEPRLERLPTLKPGERMILSG